MGLKSFLDHLVLHPYEQESLNILHRGTGISFKIAFKNLADKPSGPAGPMIEDGIELLRLKYQQT